MSQNNGTQSNGIAGALHTTFPRAMAIGAFTAISWYNVLELNVIIWWTFKQRRGLYFYSLLAASWGIIFHQLGYIMRFFEVWKNNYVSEAVVNLGWYFMVTGQSLVLYSRLHLVVRNHRRVRWILYMIVIGFFILHVPTSTLDFFCVYNASKYIPAFGIMEKIQVTGFFLQEVIISGLYIYETHKLLRPAGTFKKDQIRRVMRHLVYINFLIILLDIVVLITEYAGLFDIQVIFKGAVYSVKLRIEFAILNQLVKLAGDGARSSQKNSKSVYWLSGSGNEADHTGGGEVALETFDATGDHGSGGVSNNANKGGLGYIFPAGKGMSSQLTPKLADRDNHVVRTTEVAANPSSREVVQMRRSRRDGGEIDDGWLAEEKRKGIYKNKAADGNGGSPASSEVGFAGRGF